MAENDPLAGGQEMTTQSVTFGKVGDFIKGTYTGKKLIDDPNKKGQKVMIYEVKGMVGGYHAVDKNKLPVEPLIDIMTGSYYIVWGGKQSIDDLFSRSRFGDIVGVHLKDTKPSENKSHADIKIYSVRTFGIDDTWAGEGSQTTEAVGVGA